MDEPLIINNVNHDPSQITHSYDELDPELELENMSIEEEEEMKELR